MSALPDAGNPLAAVPSIPAPKPRRARGPSRKLQEKIQDARQEGWEAAMDMASKVGWAVFAIGLGLGIGAGAWWWS